MKKYDLTKLLAMMGLICVCTLYASLSQAGTITDNFDGPTINNKLWRPFHHSQHQWVAQQGDELKIHIDGASVGDEFGAGVASKFCLKGDFDMTVAYRVLDWPPANGVRLGFEGISTGPDVEFMVKRRSPGSAELNPGEQYSADFRDGEIWYGFVIKDDLPVGGLRLTRVGSLLAGYYADTPGAWLPIFSHDYPAAELPEWLGISLWANSKGAFFAGQDVEIGFDDFQVTYDQIRYLSSDPAILDLLLLD